MSNRINKFLEKFFSKEISLDTLSEEKLLLLLEEKTKQKMNNERMEWCVANWSRPFWSGFFRKRSPMPPRYVSRAEAAAALKRLKNMDHRPNG